MKSPWKYPTRQWNPLDKYAHAINREVVDDPAWNIEHCLTNIAMLEKEVNKTMDLIEFWKQELKEWKSKIKVGVI